MTYITKIANKNHEATRANLVIAEVLEARKTLDPRPLVEIKVGPKMYENINNYAELLLPIKKQPQMRKRYLTQLYGVKVIIDPELKPNEYKFIYAN